MRRTPIRDDGASNHAMRPDALALLFGLSALLAGCPPTDTKDYYKLAAGNQWEYYLTDGGVDDEVWDLQVLDADDNEDTTRGDLWFLLQRTEPPQEPGFDPLVVTQRSFNINLEQSIEDDQTVDDGWTYKWVQAEEGERNEFFVKTPSGADDWTDSWDFSVSEAVGSSEFYFSINASTRTEPLQTPYGTYEDCIEYERSIDIEHNDGSSDSVLHLETWAEGVGLIRYRVTARLPEGGESSTEAQLRFTNVAAIPGSE